MGGAEGKVAYIGTKMSLILRFLSELTFSSDTEGTFRPERQELCYLFGISKNWTTKTLTNAESPK